MACGLLCYRLPSSDGLAMEAVTHTFVILAGLAAVEKQLPKLAMDSIVNAPAVRTGQALWGANGS
jgi:hypothetical protein